MDWAMGWIDLRVGIGRDKEALHCWAICQARASLIAKVTTSCSDSMTLTKHNLFLADHRYQITQGNRAASDSPKGVRQIILLFCCRRWAMVGTLLGDGEWRTGRRSHTRLAKGHSRKRWRSVSCCPHRLHLKSPASPLASRFEPTAMAPLLIFHSKCFSLGEVLTFQMQAFQLNSKLDDSVWIFRSA